MSTTAAILLGNITGLIAGVTITILLLRSRISTTQIKGKVKQKNTRGSTQDVTNSISKPEKKKLSFKEKRALRKQK